MGTSSLALYYRLKEVVEPQKGYFTAKQAVAWGYQDEVHRYHVQNGDWIKAYRGIYRLAEVPEDPWADLIVWSLWSRDRKGLPQGVFCRETALAVHGKALFRPNLIQMTVPPRFRKNCALPDPLKLFKEPLFDHEIEKMPGFSVTTLEKTRFDLENDINPKKHAPISENWARNDAFERVLSQGMD
ncbi:MAG TPA: hypothetical protein DCZ95_20070 [Verrucomicrobia bacterium]|nr:MAG: hypothetical protein A2X46_17975 [Lentisphaerae bacterium GWF2_57_35]HBA86383.1 hypothetical protein [Verrucomicrobiota bacterium]